MENSKVVHIYTVYHRVMCIKLSIPQVLPQTIPRLYTFFTHGVALGSLVYVVASQNRHQVTTRPFQLSE